MDESSKNIKNPRSAFMEVEVRSVTELQSLMSACVNSGLDADVFLDFIDLKLCVDQIVENRKEAIKILMNSYGIMNPEKHVLANRTEVAWSYRKHKKAAEIEVKLAAINKRKVRLSPVKFIPHGQFHAFTTRSTGSGPLAFNVIVKLQKYLLKRDNMIG